jgi:UDP-N-acetylglucosamine--N-acetylmuramyl-(pentapeptide) pyrophosphoryl-undecaprenol N-acetylglucosamine transferase
LKSFFQVSNIFKSFKPNAVIGVGGYSSFPVLRYAQAKGIDTFIHESNSYAGKSNKMLAKKATKIFVAIDGMDKFFPSNKIIQTGNPVRENIVSSKLSREEAILFFGLDPNKKTVLAIGGSLGAKNINEALAAGINEFNKNDLQLIWQTGKSYVEKAREIAKGKSNIWVNDFITQMENAYGAADIVISRSGAMSIAELAVMKKPAVLVPFPFAAEDHQTVNAQRLVDKNAAMMINDSAALDQLVLSVIDLSKNEKKQQELKKNISGLSVINADEVIAKEILKALEKRED